MDATEKLFLLAGAACPGATVAAAVQIVGGGSVCQTTLCKLRITAPDIEGAIETRGVTPEEATHGLKKKWATARRAYDTARVLEYCEREAGGLDEDTRARMENELLYCGATTFPSIAARCRKSAQAIGQQQQAA